MKLVSQNVNLTVPLSGGGYSTGRQHRIRCRLHRLAHRINVKRRINHRRAHIVVTKRHADYDEAHTVTAWRLSIVRRRSCMRRFLIAARPIKLYREMPWWYRAALTVADPQCTSEEAIGQYGKSEMFNVDRARNLLAMPSRGCRGRRSPEHGRY